MSLLSNVTKDYLNSFYCILDEMIDGMTGAKLTDSISYNFIVQMIPHHRAAIEMSKNILKYTTCIPLQNIAEGIIREQTQSIANMRRIAEQCGELVNPRRDIALYQRTVNRILQRMFSEMSDAYANNNINNDFMREMIPHHMGAIRLSENALQYDICRGLKPILNAIITSQKRGVYRMEQLLNSGCCE